jgi:hypothetical protein
MTVFNTRVAVLAFVGANSEDEACRELERRLKAAGFGIDHSHGSSNAFPSTITISPNPWPPKRQRKKKR